MSEKQKLGPAKLPLLFKVRKIVWSTQSVGYDASLTEECLVWKCLHLLKKCVIQKPSPLPFFYLFCFSCCISFFQSTTGECKVTSAPAGDKNFDKSPTKTRQPRKVDLRARYWAFLFDNLRRAVDEIYVTCESDQSVVECKVRLSLFYFICCDFSLDASCL